MAAEDRAELAQLEWHQHKQSIKTLLVLGIVLGALTVVVLLVLTMALVVQFWDTPQRIPVVWGLVAGWSLIWALSVWRLLSAVKELSDPFRLTRHELKADWKAVRRKI
ncbi:phage holin family protein [Comamonas testosteroni]|uniref:Phage holin family protein n=1 Tax=Comamonas testosteroni TaxID=285 RepID=A0A373FTJ7_COMTE|nr:phage holin family protein [Comamonas testosteroni]